MAGIRALFKSVYVHFFDSPNSFELNIYRVFQCVRESHRVVVERKNWTLFLLCLILWKLILCVWKFYVDFCAQVVLSATITYRKGNKQRSKAHAKKKCCVSAINTNGGVQLAECTLTKFALAEEDVISARLRVLFFYRTFPLEYSHLPREQIFIERIRAVQ